MTEFITSIPDGLKHILDSISITKKYLRIHFIGGQIVAETIIQDVSKFKNNIRKELKNNDIDKQKINQIISLIQNNCDKVYPDVEDDVSSDSDVKPSVNGTKESQTSKIDISFEEWQSTLKEKYDAIRETCNSNFPGIWHSLEFELSS